MEDLEHSSYFASQEQEYAFSIDDLMDQYSDVELHLVYTYVKNRTVAEDLTQVIFIKCYEKVKGSLL
ncbi:RNA polymerase factor sigma C [Evansella cellulosilytica DSM 2522]|uniref:RNA polymerase factor sigma C n=1 Tax=Evansella cellulosilytica (strain ATCC 21833 / DSM 2522 / FERM P-1141 / JCM 9156 / N-4) TaxID=649639 RepID=E6TT27_EVAC2|nr:RNA polymerase factor sigma C [Evansella cellulosilytica DSM 2522]